jgi:hypothetical protein
MTAEESKTLTFDEMAFRMSKQFPWIITRETLTNMAKQILDDGLYKEVLVIVKALSESEADYFVYSDWAAETMQTPKPLETKDDLISFL